MASISAAWGTVSSSGGSSTVVWACDELVISINSELVTSRPFRVGAAIAAGWAVAGAVVPPRILPVSVGEAWLVHPWRIIVVGSVLVVVGTGAITS